MIDTKGFRAPGGQDQGHVRIVIPTRNSARWIGAFYAAYRKSGYEPLYVFDTRSNDDTAGVLRRAGAEVLEFTPQGDFVESGIAQYALEMAGTPWVMRLDDDEFPSVQFFKWLSSEFRSTSPAVLISRRELFFHHGEIAYSRATGRLGQPDRPDFVHAQPRLCRPALLEANYEVHTAGFHEPAFYDYAPPDAFFAHFSCLLRTPDERLEKIRTYERIKPGSSWYLLDEYLPELFDAAHHNPGRDDLTQFEPLLETLPLAEPSSDVALSEQELAFAVSQMHEFARRIEASREAYARSFGSVSQQSRSAGACGRHETAFDLSATALPGWIDHASGFSFREHWGRWILGRRAEIRFVSKLPRLFALEVRCRIFSPLAPCNVEVRVGRRSAILRFDGPEWQDYLILGATATRTDTVSFTADSARSPEEVGISGDTRQLSMAMAWVRLCPLTFIGKRHAKRVWLT